MGGDVFFVAMAIQPVASQKSTLEARSTLHHFGLLRNLVDFEFAGVLGSLVPLQPEVCSHCRLSQSCSIDGSRQMMKRSRKVIS